MSFLKRFWKKEKEEVKEEPIELKVEEKTPLEKICAGEPEVYEALYETMLLEPKKVNTSLEEAIEKAKNFEKNNEKIRAKIWYKIAGGLAIAKGDLSEIRHLFKKCAELNPAFNAKILEPGIAERAVAKAQEYYRKYPSEETKKQKT